LEWAFTNVVQDYKEQGKLLFSFMDALTWWLQPEIKAKLSRAGAQQWPDAKNYLNELRKMGASDEYIQKELAAMRKEQAKNAGFSDDDQGDDLVVLKGPKRE
jgi:hypothetical protein